MADATGIVVSRLRTKGPSGYRYYTFRATTSTSETIPIAGLSTIIGAIGKAAATAGANSVTANINGNPLLAGSVAAGLDTALKLRPYILCGNRSTSARTFTIDYIALWCNRQ